MRIIHVLFTEEVVLFVLIVFVSIFVHANQGSRLHIINPRNETTSGFSSQSKKCLSSNYMQAKKNLTELKNRVSKSYGLILEAKTSTTQSDSSKIGNSHGSQQQ